MKNIFVYSLLTAIQILSNPFNTNAVAIPTDISAGVAPMRSPVDEFISSYLPYILIPIAVLVVIGSVMIGVAKFKKTKKK